MDQVIIAPLKPNLQVPEIRAPRIQEDQKGGTAFGEILKDAISNCRPASEAVGPGDTEADVGRVTRPAYHCDRDAES